MSDFKLDFEFVDNGQKLTVSDTLHGEVLCITRSKDGVFTSDYDIELSFADEVYRLCVDTVNAFTEGKTQAEVKYLPGSRSLQRRVNQDSHKEEFLAQIESIFKRKA